MLQSLCHSTLTDIAASEGWLLHHVDIMAVPLRRAKEPILKLSFLRRVERGVSSRVDHYWLKQSPREWYHLLDGVLILWDLYALKQILSPAVAIPVVGPCGIMGI